jgi:hypothetical protein
MQAGMTGIVASSGSQASMYYPPNLSSSAQYVHGANGTAFFLGVDVELIQDFVVLGGEVAEGKWLEREEDLRIWVLILI